MKHRSGEWRSWTHIRDRLWGDPPRVHDTGPGTIRGSEPTGRGQFEQREAHAKEQRGGAGRTDERGSQGPRRGEESGPAGSDEEARRREARTRKRTATTQ